MPDRAHDNAPNDASRRAFLATSAAAIGAAAVGASAAAEPRAAVARIDPTVPERAFNPPGAGETIRLGIIGAGTMGHAHAVGFAHMAREAGVDVAIAAIADVCDPHAAKARHDCQQIQESFIELTRDHRDLLDRDEIHGVVVASPEHWHAQHAIDVLHAGKDLYLEKPVALRLDQAIAVHRAAERRPDQLVQVGTHTVVSPKCTASRAAIQGGLIGKAVRSETSYCRNSHIGEWNEIPLDPAWKPGANIDWNTWLGHLGPREWDPKLFARWRRYREFSTGVVGDMLVHAIAPIIHAVDAGWPVRVHAIGGHYADLEMENHDEVSITVQLEGDHTMVAIGSTINELGVAPIIHGTEANMFLNSRNVLIRPERIHAITADEKRINCPSAGNLHQVLRRDWLTCMRTRDAVASGLELGMKVMVVVELATRSMWDGGSYTFDPRTMAVARS